jgi:hypothetical protein
MLTGNTMPGIQVADYADVREGVEIMRNFIDQILTS